jgi:hypothetical protein
MEVNQMRVKRLGLSITLLLCLIVVLVTVQRLGARQGLMAPLQSPDQLRFQLIGDEQIAGPDGRTIVNGWSVLIFKDRRAPHCYVAFKQGSSITAMESSECPP